MQLTGASKPATHRCGLPFLAALLSGVGCAIVPSVPAGPIGGSGVRLGATFAYAYAPATARTLQASGVPYTLRSNSSMFRGLAPLAPLRAMVRASAGPCLDFGADLGWLDAGLQLRAGQLDARRRLPWGLELEWRTGQLTVFDSAVARQVRIYRARAELYPMLGARFADMDGFGVLTVGVSSGVQHHFMFVPAVADPTVDTTGDGFASSELEVARSETRLEVSLGLHGRGPAGAVTVALQPWLGLHQGAVRDATCAACALELQSLDVPWGLGLVVGGSLVWEKESY
jgi:hypothetical protein